MMELFEALMKFFIQHRVLLSLVILLIPTLILYFARFDAMYQSPVRYFMGLLSLVVSVSIFLLAIPFWIVVVSGYSNFLTFLATVVLFILGLYNLLMTANFFLRGKIIKWLKLMLSN